MEYRDFLIVRDSAGDGFIIFDSDGDILDEGLVSLDQAKAVIDEAYIVYGL